MQDTESTGRDAARLVQVAEWERFGWLRHGFSTRLGGASSVYGEHDLNLGFTKEDDRQNVRENRRRFLSAMGSTDGPERLISVRQVHGSVVEMVKHDFAEAVDDDGRLAVEADGLMTDVPGCVLAIQVADCVPILIADTRRQIVAALHAGWRGTAARIVERGIAQMATEFGSDPGDMVAAVGPSIRGCCYAVGDEVKSAFCSAMPYADDLFSVRENQTYLDLAAANRRQMLTAGLSAGNITVLAECSGCATISGKRKYFSHRVEQGFTGRMMGAIGIAKDVRTLKEDRRT